MDEMRGEGIMCVSLTRSGSSDGERESGKMCLSVCEDGGEKRECSSYLWLAMKSHCMRVNIFISRMMFDISSHKALQCHFSISWRKSSRAFGSMTVSIARPMATFVPFFTSGPFTRIAFLADSLLISLFQPFPWSMIGLLFCCCFLF